MPALIRLLDVPRRARMLEVGCGGGVALVPFFRLCAPTRLVGLDQDLVLLAAAQERIRRRNIDAELVHGDVRDLPFPDASFDVVIDFGTCYHIARPEAALLEISRVLTRGGVFVHETRAAQLLAHPIRSSGRRIPWEAEPALERHRAALLWAARRKRA